ncbi:hypothetical protein HMPREF9555_02121 [Selenomonas artemidis F0399]|uniref:Uncharacterized protein n=1 Tax=Selenomonas artemidis F0399 TaxID=749551 RepID=E7N526_9FIRM|nr:hypothetical protein HMPREF9555_02121 [Selenomonas artemidis F0399]
MLRCSLSKFLLKLYVKNSDDMIKGSEKFAGARKEGKLTRRTGRNGSGGSRDEHGNVNRKSQQRPLIR